MFMCTYIYTRVHRHIVNIRKRSKKNRKCKQPGRDSGVEVVKWSTKLSCVGTLLHTRFEPFTSQMHPSITYIIREKVGGLVTRHHLPTYIELSEQFPCTRSQQKLVKLMTAGQRLYF